MAPGADTDIKESIFMNMIHKNNQVKNSGSFDPGWF